MLEKTLTLVKERSLLVQMAFEYVQFCSNMELKQLIKVRTGATCNTSVLIDHILSNSREKVVQAGITETSLSDHQLIFCTRKIKRENLINKIILHFALLNIFQLISTRKPRVS